MKRPLHRAPPDIEVFMRRFITKAIVIGGLLSPLALATQGCADNETMLFVRAVLKLEAGECLAKGDPNSTMLLGGVMDLHFRDNYNAALLVGNQLVRRGSKNLLRNESNRVVLKGAEVTLLDDQENVVAEFTVPGVGFVDVGTGEDPGYGVIATTLIPSGLAQPNALYLVDVRAFGETLGGTEITSAALRYPIYTCDRCLITYPQDAADPAQLPAYMCIGGEASEDPLPCYLGQDDYIDCRICSASDPACQTPGG
ncbi:MAG: hypothetical protein HS104_03565 [Polyangiaceae bacterium]|nr:hypothetical protein [Polyangiaceae bacterium]MCL4750530.1 hypothetical protein [Myxococcales bacterium]